MSTKVRLSRDAKVPRGAKVTLDVTLTYEVPWSDTLENLDELELTINEYLADLAVTYGRHTPVAYVAGQEKWDVLSDGHEVTFTVCPLDVDGHEAGNDIEVEQEWENEQRKKGGWTPKDHEYREALGG
jgi:hypothetical protein